MKVRRAGEVTARGEVWVTVTARGLARCGFRNVRAGEFRNVRAGDKAERSEVWVTDNESRAKRGVGYAMLVIMILILIMIMMI